MTAMSPRSMAQQGHFKDEILERLSGSANVAQFVSFAPDLSQRFLRLRGRSPDHRFLSLPEAAAAMLNASPERSVNIRSFQPDSPKSREFIYGCRAADEAVAHVQRMAGRGLYTIVNETVDVEDGGVSGVCYGELVELAPEDTPRCVEKPGTVSLPRQWAWRLLETVYGFRPQVPADEDLRVEFSVHPLRRGYRNGHTVIWEVEEAGHPPAALYPSWPNRFSRFIGDKAFGLLVAALLDLPVPLTTVVSRKVAPFTFGRRTGTQEVWIRTCPIEQVPGHFTTERGWRDPFQLMQTEDPQGGSIASILSQQGVLARYSGALICQKDGRPLIEGVQGFGDLFMKGGAAPQQLPSQVENKVHELYKGISSRLGPVRFEWVHDGTRTWIVQLHRGTVEGQGQVIYPGQAEKEHRFPVERGLEELRELIEQVRGTGEGIVLEGHIGVTSHFGDVLRKAEVPSRLSRGAPEG
ncbi:MAG TPA: hypothetical protein VLU25_13645 [Acidobacteriota bacterium]|nr:hypothetical protein [Acidobacteriota bacterium]